MKKRILNPNDSKHCPLNTPNTRKFRVEMNGNFQSGHFLFSFFNQIAPSFFRVFRVFSRLNSKCIRLSFVVVLFAGIHAGFAEEIPKVIRIGALGGGFGKSYTTGNFAVLQEQKALEEEFKAEGIKIEWTLFPGGPAINEVLASNGIDISDYGDLPTIIGKSVGLKTVVLAAGYRGNLTYIAVPPNSPAKTIADLKGKTVGIAKGTYMHLAFVRKLESLGLSERDVKLVNVRGAEGQNAVVTGDLDAFVGSSTLLKLRDKNGVKILYTSKTEPEDWKGTNALIVQEDFLKKYPDITKRVLKRFLLAAQWRSDESHRTESQKLDARSGTDLSLIVENQAGLNLKELYNPRFDEAFVNHYKNAVLLAKQQGLIQNEINVDQWLNRELLDQELKEIHWN